MRSPIGVLGVDLRSGSFVLGFDRFVLDWRCRVIFFRRVCGKERILEQLVGFRSGDAVIAHLWHYFRRGIRVRSVLIGDGFSGTV